MRRALVVTLLSVALSPALLVLTTSEAEACSCMKAPPALEAARSVDVVFHGKLVSVADAPKSGQYDLPNKIFTFEVVRTFKGQLDAQVNVLTADNSAACGRNYGDPDSEWLIYARVDDQGQTHDNLCSRTRAIDAAADDIAELEANADSLDQPPEQTTPEEPGPAEPEPEPVLPETAEDGPEPAAPSKKGCAVIDATPADLGGLAGLLGLGLVLARRRRS